MLHDLPIVSLAANKGYKANGSVYLLQVPEDWSMVREAAQQLTEALVVVSTRTNLRERVFRDSSTRVDSVGAS